MKYKQYNTGRCERINAKTIHNWWSHVHPINIDTADIHVWSLNGENGWRPGLSFHITYFGLLPMSSKPSETNLSTPYSLLVRKPWFMVCPIRLYSVVFIDWFISADTCTHGKPDMVKLTYKLVREFDAEAVVIISNPTLTYKVVYGLASRGIPAYGAIWDSWVFCV